MTTYYKAVRPDGTDFRTGTEEDLRAKIARCEVVCANCHRIRSASRPHGSRGRDGCGHEATGRTLAMVVQHSGIEFDPARYLADPRRLCRGCRIKAGWRVEP